MPLSLGDTTITITDARGSALPAPLYYVSPSQATFLIPEAAAPGTASVKIARGATTVSTGTMTVAPIAPGIYTANGNGAGAAAAIYIRASAPETFAFTFTCQPDLPLSCLSAPISLGAPADIYLVLYASGIRAAKDVQVFIAGQSVPVSYAGAQGTGQGLDQVNVTLPRSLAGMGEVSVYLTAGGKTSNVASINLQ